jgi:hypothetical protein
MMNVKTIFFRPAALRCPLQTLQFSRGQGSPSPLHERSEGDIPNRRADQPDRIMPEGLEGPADHPVSSVLDREGQPGAPPVHFIDTDQGRREPPIFKVDPLLQGLDLGPLKDPRHLDRISDG